MVVSERIRAETVLDGRFKRHKILAGERVLACFNPGDDGASVLLRRPSLHPIYTPAGLPVTEQGAHNYPHHKGVFLTLGKINDTNVYVDTTHNSGRLVAREVSFSQEGPALVMETEIDWLDARGDVLIAERRVHRFYAGEADGVANRIDIDSQLRTPLSGGADLPKNKHAYFHCRVIDAIDEDDGGTVTASNGITGADAIFETEGNWIDTRGRIGPNAVGIAIMVHPDFGPQPLFARTYGTVALNPFAKEGRRLEPGEVYRSVYGVWAYDRPGDFDVARAYDRFARTAVVG